jgi:hypothetical protein
LARLLLTIYAEWLKRITINAAVSGSVHQGNQGNQMFVERFSNFILFFFSHNNNTQLWSTGTPLVYCCYYIFTTSNAMKEKKKGNCP